MGKIDIKVTFSRRNLRAIKLVGDQNRFWKNSEERRLQHAAESGVSHILGQTSIIEERRVIY